MDNVPKMVLDPDPTLAAMLRGRTYLYIHQCNIKANWGFGISFEITERYHPLPVPIIATMLDASITVRETHFTDNTLGNMGKIPGPWIEKKQDKSDEVVKTIRDINPGLFVETPTPVAAVTHIPIAMVDSDHDIDDDDIDNIDNIDDIDDDEEKKEEEYVEKEYGTSQHDGDQDQDQDEEENQDDDITQAKNKNAKEENNSEDSDI